MRKGRLPLSVEQEIDANERSQQPRRRLRAEKRQAGVSERQWWRAQFASAD
jgi:hypothetical protein